MTVTRLDDDDHHDSTHEPESLALAHHDDVGFKFKESDVQVRPCRTGSGLIEPESEHHPSHDVLSLSHESATQGSASDSDSARPGS